MAIVYLSVCVHNRKSGVEGYSELNISRKDAHDTGDSWPDLEVKKSKPKVTRPLNAVTKNAIFLERQGVRTSNLVYRWSTMIRVTDTRGDLEGQGHQAAVGGCLS